MTYAAHNEAEVSTLMTLQQTQLPLILKCCSAFAYAHTGILHFIWCKGMILVTLVLFYLNPS